MRRTKVLLGIFCLAFLILFTAAAKSPKTKAKPSAESDAAADELLGALPEESEVEKKASPQKSQETLEDLEKKERESELERLHRNITDPNQ